MKFQVFIFVFVIALGIIVEARRLRGSSRIGSRVSSRIGSRGSSRIGSIGSSHRSGSLRRKPVRTTPVYRPPRVRTTPVHRPPRVRTTPVYHPPPVRTTPVYHPPPIRSTPVHHPPTNRTTPVYHPPTNRTTPVYHPPSNRTTPAYHPPPVRTTPVYHPLTIRNTPAYHPQTIRTTPAYHPPAVRTPSAVPKPTATSPKNSITKAPTNDHNQRNSSALREPINRVNATLTQNKPYPDWANPEAKPVSPPLGLPTHFSAPFPNSHPSNRPMPTASDIGFQSNHPGYGQSPMPGGSYVPPMIILHIQSSSEPGIGQLAKEALVYSTINRIIKGAPHHYHSSSPPAQPAVVAGSTTSIVNNTTIITIYGSSDQSSSGGNGNAAQGTYVPNNPGAYPASPGTFSNPGSYPTIRPESGLSVNAPVISGPPPTGPVGVNIGTRIESPPSNPPSSNSTTNSSVLVHDTGNADGKNVDTTEAPVASSEYYISEEELKNLTEILFAKEEIELKRYITLNVQKKSMGDNITDQASQPLMYISPDLYDLPTIQAFKNMFNHYEFNSTLKENSTQETRREESLLLDTFLNTDTMLTAMKWLATKYYIESDDFEMKDTLRHIWFNKLEGSTSGFERVFLAERYVEKILVGAQNWIYFHHKEAAGEIDYMGYTEARNVAEEVWLLKVNMKMGDIVKQNLTMLIGISPELEMSLYTVCFYARPNDICPVSLGGNMFYLYTHTIRSFGKDIIDVGIKAF